MKIYLVIDCGNAPGRVLAIFANEDDADMFADDYEACGDSCEVEERTLFYGQPGNLGYNR